MPTAAPAPALAVSQLRYGQVDWAALPTVTSVSSGLRDVGQITSKRVDVTLHRASDRTTHAESFTVDRGALRLRSNNLIGGAERTLQTLTLTFDTDVSEVRLRVYDFNRDRYEGSPGIWQSFRDLVHIPEAQQHRTGSPEASRSSARGPG